MPAIPTYIPIFFLICVLATVLAFWQAAHRPRSFLLLVAAFMAIETIMPPLLPLIAAPPMVFMILMFTTKKGRRFIDRLDLPTLTLLHLVRIGVEFILWQLSRYHAVPTDMTFEGRNFDLLSGLTAPLVYYFAFVRHKMSARWLLLWNIACIILLLNVVIVAVLSAPGPLQRLAFDQPNIAVLHFPYRFLPGIVVPLVLFSNGVALFKLLTNRRIHGDKFFA